MQISIRHFCTCKSNVVTFAMLWRLINSLVVVVAAAAATTNTITIIIIMLYYLVEILKT